MHHLTIVADDSPLQRNKPALLSETGWDQCEPDSGPGNVNPAWVQPQEVEVLTFPPSIGPSGTSISESNSDSLPVIVIAVDKESRLLQFESHHPPASGSSRATIPSSGAVMHVMPNADSDPARTLLSQLNVVEIQDHEFLSLSHSDAISVAAHLYRQRRKQNILEELLELQDRELGVITFPPRR